jgi:hypothetical protein
MGIVMGPTAHGKTAFATPIVDGYRQQGGKVWIVDLNNNWPGYPNRLTSLIGLDEELWKLKTSGPGMIVCEDAHTYLRHPTGPRLDLMTGYRHWQKDLMIICHRPQGIPKDAIENADWLALFAIKEPYSRQYLGKLLGLEMVGQIPKKGQRFTYLYLRQDTDKRAVYKTQPRAIVTGSDQGKTGAPR